MGAGPGSERWMNVPYIENNAIVLDIPPPNDSVSRAAVRPQPLAVTQGGSPYKRMRHMKRINGKAVGAQRSD